jgi:predicted nucleotidyltransferase
MELPDQVAGRDPRQMRDMLLQFLEQERKYVWKDGVPSVVPNAVTPEFIQTSLSVSAAEAHRILKNLVSEGWVESGRLVPSMQGMALAQHVDRPRLPRAEAEAILNQVIEWAERTNAIPAARVKVKAIQLFGSLMRGEDEVGDIDLFVEFTTMDLGMALEPEDMEREEELAEELSAISEYLSPSSELERQRMAVPYRQVFPRP